jgi:hypothetical protein
MPIEFRFDDLDLREEPESAKSDEADSPTDLCTRTCTTSHNTCGTYLC